VFKKGYGPRTNIVKNEKDDLVRGSHSILSRRKNHFSQLLNTHGINDVRQKEIHTAEPLVPEPSAFDMELAIEKLKRHKSSGIGHIAAELIKAQVGQFAARSINLLILFRIRMNCLRSRSQSLYLFIRRVIKQTVEIIEAYHFCQQCTKFYPTPCCQG